MTARPKRTFDEGHSGKRVAVHRGDLFTIELRSVPHIFGWTDAATVDGAAVQFLERDVKRPPPDVDGGSNLLIYRYCARAKGKATLTIPSWGDRHAPDDFRLIVTVR